MLNAIICLATCCNSQLNAFSYIAKCHGHDITKVMHVVNVSAVSRQDTNKTSLAARDVASNLCSTVRGLSSPVYSQPLHSLRPYFVSQNAGKMAAIDTVAGQFEDAVEDQLLFTLNGKKTNRCDAEENSDDLREEEGQYSFSDGDSSEEEGGFVAWEWEGRASNLTKKYNAARLVGVTRPVGRSLTNHSHLPWQYSHR